MNVLHWILVGMCVAGLAGGSWLLLLCAGCVALSLKKSYVPIMAGIITDLTFGIVDSAWLGGFFVTSVFVVWYIGAGYIRARLFALR